MIGRRGLWKAISALRLEGFRWFAVVAIVGGSIACAACKKKISQTQCDELLDRFADLVVKERLPDAGAEAYAAERTRERGEAKNDDAFKNCVSEVQREEHACAMKASSSDALVKCLE